MTVSKRNPIATRVPGGCTPAMPSQPSFRPSEILLLGPGPSPVGAAVREAMALPVLGHLDPEFLALMERVQADLRQLFGTQHRFTLPISGTGSAGMEAVMANLVEAGDRVVVGINGVFGERLAEMARRQGADVVAVRSPMGSPVDVDAMLTAMRVKPTRLCAFVHAETSTGVLTDPLPIARGARDVGALVALDCVTSLGGVALALDAVGIDAAYSGTQKCLAVPPGLAPLTFSERAMAKIAGRAASPSSWYLDAGLLSSYWRDGKERAYHHTAPISMVYALARGLELTLEEGMPARERRHRRVAAALDAALGPLGLHNPVAPTDRLPMLTPIALPEEIDAAALRAHLRARHRIEVGAGLAAWKDRVIRVGLMGDGARAESVVALVHGLAAALAEQGRSVDGEGARRAAEAVLSTRE
ncbi:MAG: alanine--glyoxylate aminotransferase family protein [Planctomycetota bacterium]